MFKREKSQKDEALAPIREKIKRAKSEAKVAKDIAISTVKLGIDLQEAEAQREVQRRILQQAQSLQLAPLLSPSSRAPPANQGRFRELPPSPPSFDDDDLAEYEVSPPRPTIVTPPPKIPHGRATLVSRLQANPSSANTTPIQRPLRDHLQDQCKIEDDDIATGGTFMDTDV
ncbi:hypothetical protein SAMD00019534_085840 [Acytostelium subglobosum LB1]|uniref:hypothetical protein n=1 Tax=Acytostelium subglobosum LB1 TaxID=1410327 RepID=UPI00064505AF|nr:hypothetical protein SAMD00019534_085840 [Acytostelium subglobosum LB1]GAM25409.1 hypothetical protein SAMD00019534_085840 [Acytostelium subglobosum LB1]|eukprot:XP_012751929.1 hypothetical protein SAMD00019534_085840 [Acytostelium subglobosum LB1]